MFLGHVAEEAHEHRHIRMSLRRYAAQLWPEQSRHRIHHYNSESIFQRFRFAASVAEGFDGESGC